MLNYPAFCIDTWQAGLRNTYWTLRRGILILHINIYCIREAFKIKKMSQIVGKVQKGGRGVSAKKKLVYNSNVDSQRKEGGSEFFK